MRSLRLRSIFTNKKTQLTVLTAITLAFATVLATAGDDDRTKPVAKTTDAKNESARKS